MATSGSQGSQGSQGPQGLNYAKLCNAGLLTNQLIAAGILQSPTVGFQMYGVSANPAPNPNTIVWVISNVPGPTVTLINNIVAAHVYGQSIPPTLLETFIVYQAKLTWLSASTIGIGTANVLSRVTDSTGIYDMTWVGQLVANSAINGVGGLDQGTVAPSSWYAVFVIGDTSGVNAPAAMLSLSQTIPVLPAGYNIFRRLGWANTTNGSNFYVFYQTGNGTVREFFYGGSSASLNVLSNGNATSFASVSLASLVPPTSRLVTLTASFSNTGGAASDVALFRETGLSQANPVCSIAPGIVVPSVFIVQIRLGTNANQSIDYQVSNAADALSLAVVGYLDEL